MALRNQPYLPLYVQDFLTDEKLIECTAKATGIYIRIMCIMHKSDEYGTVLLKQKDKQNDEQILNFAYKLARFLPWDLQTVVEGLEELLSEKILFIEGDMLIQKRMRKDGIISDKRASAGSKGGNKTLGKTPATSGDFAQANSQANSEDENENELIHTNREMLEIEVCAAECLKNEDWIENIERVYKIDRNKIKFAIKDFLSHCITIGKNEAKTIPMFKSHFTNWVRIKKQYQL